MNVFIISCNIVFSPRFFAITCERLIFQCSNVLNTSSRIMSHSYNYYKDQGKKSHHQSKAEICALHINIHVGEIHQLTLALGVIA